MRMPDKILLLHVTPGMHAWANTLLKMRWQTCRNQSADIKKFQAVSQKSAVANRFVGCCCMSLCTPVLASRPDERD